MTKITKNDALLFAYLDVSQIITSMNECGELGCDVDSLEATLDYIREVYDGTHPLEYVENDGDDEPPTSDRTFWLDEKGALCYTAN